MTAEVGLLVPGTPTFSGTDTVNVRIRARARAFGSAPEDPNWNMMGDLNNDEIINIVDVSIIAMDYGKTV